LLVQVLQQGDGAVDFGTDLGDLPAGGGVGFEPAFVVADKFYNSLCSLELVAFEEEQSELQIGPGGEGGIADALGFGGDGHAGYLVGEGPEGGDLGGAVFVEGLEEVLDGAVGDGESAGGAVTDGTGAS